MKKKLVSGLVGLVVVAGAAFFVVGSAGVPHKPPDYESTRGTDAYYTGDRLTKDLPDWVGNLSKSKLFVKVGVTLEYRLGPELADASAVFSERNAEIRDVMLSLFAGKALEDVEGAEGKELVKQELRNRLQTVLFPDKKGRLEKVLFRDFYVQ